MEKFKKKKITNIKKLFFKNGYVVLKSFYKKKEIFSLLQSVISILDLAISKKKISLRKNIFKNIYDEINYKYLYLKRTNPKLKANIYNQLKKLDKLSYLFANKKILQVVEKLMSGNSMIDNMQIRIDDPSNDRLLNMHQELNQKSLTNITTWIPLQDILNKKIGGIQIAPGSHKNGFIRHQETGPKHNKYLGLDSHEIKKLKIKGVPVFLKTGDVLMFHPLLVHGSIPNKSNQIRWTSIARYNSFNNLRLFYDGKEFYTGEKNQILYQKFYNKNFFTWI